MKATIEESPTINSLSTKTIKEFNSRISSASLTNQVPWLGVDFKDQLAEENSSTTSLLDLAAIELTEAIQKAAKASIPYTRPRPSPKAWWTPELRELRKAIL